MRCRSIALLLSACLLLALAGCRPPEPSAFADEDLKTVEGVSVSVDASECPPLDKLTWDLVNDTDEEIIYSVDLTVEVWKDDGWYLFYKPAMIKCIAGVVFAHSDLTNHYFGYHDAPDPKPERYRLISDIAGVNMSAEFEISE